MATNVNNAERLRSYFLSHKQRENIINVCRYTVDCFAGTPIENSPFDSCVSMIKWLIAKGYFSKEFLL